MLRVVLKILCKAGVVSALGHSLYPPVKVLACIQILTDEASDVDPDIQHFMNPDQVRILVIQNIF